MSKFLPFVSFSNHHTDNEKYNNRTSFIITRLEPRWEIIHIKKERNFFLITIANGNSELKVRYDHKNIYNLSKEYEFMEIAWKWETLVWNKNKNPIMGWKPYLKNVI